ncbi:MAG: helicase-related protein [Pseudomonadota bacterium]
MPRLKAFPDHLTKRALSGEMPLIAMLGPTNTGKTYFAIERLLAHRSGMIGLPLRLLAREVYDKLIDRVGSREVALVTGEEKIIPASARYWIATVEAMPLERPVEFLAIDEVQLAADEERGRIFTSRLLHARGTKETVFLGAETMRPILQRMFPDIEVQTRERFSQLSYAGSKKVTRLPRRTAIVGFSSDMVYATAELVRRQRGGAAVIMGALSPRTRNAQAALYQNGEVDYLIATDAIGMGLNMDIDHVAFSACRKFDGRRMRLLTNNEIAQIAGRAGRHIKDGSFGVTAQCPDLEDDVVEAVENHTFKPIDALQWRSETLDFSSLHALRLSLEQIPKNDLLKRARPGDDEVALARMISNLAVRERAKGTANISLLWDICQIPDYSKLSFDQHTTLLLDVFDQISGVGHVSEGWLAPKVERLNRTDGDIDTISARISQIRTWTYLSNRPGWIENAAHWRQESRAIEDRLSDALHEKLTQRFVDRRTSVLLKKLNDDAPLLAGVSQDGEVTVEGQFVGRLLGFEFIVDPSAKGPEAKRVRYAAERALKPVLAARAAAMANADTSEFELLADGSIQWRSSIIATLEKGPAQLRPNIRMRNLDALSPTMRGRVNDKVAEFVAVRVEALLGDLIRLKQAIDDESTDIAAVARGVAYRLVENFGAMSRAPISGELKQIEQAERAKLRKLGVRFGEYTLFVPSILKPAAARLLIMLWSLWTDREPKSFEPPKAGLVSFALDQDVPHAYYYASGYRPSGERAVRIDMLERLAGLIRTAREGGSAKQGFEVTSQMMSIVGCSGDDFEGILRSLGYRKETIKRKKETEAPTQSGDGANSDEASSNAGSSPDGASTEATVPAEGIATDQSSQDKSTEETILEEQTQDDQSTAVSSEHRTPNATAEANPPEQGNPAPDSSLEDANVKSDAPTQATETIPSIEAQSEPGLSIAPLTAEATTPDGAESTPPKTQDEAPAETPETPVSAESEVDDEMVEVEVWRMVPRRPQQRSQRRPQKDENGQNRRQADGNNAAQRNSKQQNGKPFSGRDGDKRDDKFGGKRGKKGGPRRDKQNQAPRQYNAGPKRSKGPDPDSPFAVLAALKSDGDDTAGNS